MKAIGGYGASFAPAAQKFATKSLLPAGALKH